MSGMPGPHLALVLSLLGTLGGLFLLSAIVRNARATLQARIRSVRLSWGIAKVEVVNTPDSILKRVLYLIGHSILNSGLLSRQATDDFLQTLAAAGYRNAPALALFVAAKVLLFIGLPLLAWIFIHLTGMQVKELLVMAMFAAIGLLAPDYAVRSFRRRYLKEVDKGLPAALDLLIICADAGLAFEVGLDRVADEIDDAIHATANELRITANEMKILTDRRLALVNMGKRTGLESMARLGSTLAQSLKYGTPLGHALSVLAAEMRQTELARFEAQAARIPVLLTMPMVIFILPCMFLVVGGPAAIMVMQTLANR